MTTETDFLITNCKGVLQLVCSCYGSSYIRDYGSKNLQIMIY